MLIVYIIGGISVYLFIGCLLVWLASWLMADDPGDDFWTYATCWPIWVGIGAIAAVIELPKQICSNIAERNRR